VCGNGVCQSLENCANCPGDCGACPPQNCEDIAPCTVDCLFPPDNVFSCVNACGNGACADAAFFADQFFNCAFGQILTFPPCLNFACFTRRCSAQWSACQMQGTCD
jgi:hypothetical protein